MRGTMTGLCVCLDRHAFKTVPSRRRHNLSVSGGQKKRGQQETDSRRATPPPASPPPSPTSISPTLRPPHAATPASQPTRSAASQLGCLPARPPPRHARGRRRGRLKRPFHLPLSVPPPLGAGAACRDGAPRSKSGRGGRGERDGPAASDHAPRRQGCGGGAVRAAVAASTCHHPRGGAQQLRRWRR